MTVIDLSHHQNDAGPINYAAVRRACAGAYVKLTQGTGFVDPAAKANHDGLAGIPRGAYHYCTGTDPATEARFFAAQLAKTGPWELRPAIDIEYAGATSTWLRAFVAAFRAASGIRRVRVYAGYFDIRSALAPTTWIDPDIDLWIARYNATLGWDHPQLVLWQHTATAATPGIRGHTDQSTEQHGWTPAADRPTPTPRPTPGDVMTLTPADIAAVANAVVAKLLAAPLPDLYPAKVVRQLTVGDTVAWAAAHAARGEDNAWNANQSATGARGDIAALAELIKHLPAAAGGTVDADAVAERVLDGLAARLAQ